MTIMSTTFATAVYIEARPVDVFDALTDLDSRKDWVPNLVSIEKLTPSPVGEGTEWRETRTVFGKQTIEHIRVTRLTPPSRIDLRMDSSKGTSSRGECVFTYELLPERTGTNVELSGEIRMRGVLDLFSRRFAGRTKKACHADLEALKRHLEARFRARAS
jgi:uncharacterized protein YndB with AHSA1/START domain